MDLSGLMRKLPRRKTTVPEREFERINEMERWFIILNYALMLADAEVFKKKH